MKKVIWSVLLSLLIGTSFTAADLPGNCGCGTGQEHSAADFVLDGKLANSQEIIRRFEQGNERVRIIVNLSEPQETKAATNWNSTASLKVLHNRMKAIRTPVLSALSANEFRLRHRFENQAGFSGEITLEGLGRLLNHPGVVSIEPVYVLQPHLSQGIALINAAAVRSTYNGQGVSIAICDTGIDYTHPKLGDGGFPNDKVIGGYDFGDDDANPMPHNSQPHGTACAGIAAGDLGSVGDYVGGVAYNAKLYALKITAGSDNIAYSSDIAAAWDWCVSHKNDDPDHPIMAISTSFGGGRLYGACDGYSLAVTMAANNAVAAGITVLASSGNDGYCDSICWPACISNVISVGAVYDAGFGLFQPCISEESCATKYPSGGCTTGYYAKDYTAADMVTSYSNTASFLDILAPSNRTYTTDIAGPVGYSSGDYYASFGGTSAASPYAAGAVACLQQAALVLTGNYLTPDEVTSTVTDTGDDITDDKIAITKPRINLAGAIESLGEVEPVPGDANEDGKVTIVDFLTLQNNFNQSGGWAEGDFNDDAMVTIADFIILQNNWGYGTDGGTAEDAEEIARFAAAIGLLGEQDRPAEAGGQGNKNDASDKAVNDPSVPCSAAAIVLAALICLGFLAVIETEEP